MLTVLLSFTLVGIFAAQVTTTAAQTTTPDPSGRCGNGTTCVAFSVARNTSQNQGIVYYNQVILNDGDGFDATNSMYQAPVSGYYWIHVSAGITTNTPGEVYTVGTNRLARIAVTTTATNGEDTVSRDEVFTLGNQCGSVQVLSVYPVFSNTFLQSSFSGFSIASVSEDPYAIFSVALSVNAVCASGTKVPFDTVLIDTANSWNPSQHHYTAPETGTYIISLMVGSQSSQPFAVGLYIEGSPLVISSLQLGSTNHNFESQSQLTMVDLEVGESIYAGCFSYANSYIHGNVDYQTIFTGFRYNPRLVAFAWSVAATNSWTGLTDPIPFPVVLVNRGQGWNPVTYDYDVLQDGIYYLHITAGVAAGQPTMMELLLNGSPIINIYRPASNQDGIKSRSRAILWRLYQGEVLRLRVPAGYTVHSTNERLTTFSGFRLYV